MATLLAIDIDPPRLVSVECGLPGAPAKTKLDLGVPRALAKSPDSMNLAVATEDNVLIVDPSSLSTITMLNIGYSSMAAFSPCGSYLALGGCNEGSLYLYAARSWVLIKALIEHASYLLAANFTPSSRKLVTSGQDARIVIWSVPSLDVIQTICFAAPDTSILAVLFISETQFIAASDDHRVNLYVEGPGLQFHNQMALTHHTAEVFALAMSPSNDIFASASADGTVKTYSTRTLDLLGSYILAGPVRSVALVDSNTIVAGIKGNYMTELSTSTGAIKQYGAFVFPRAIIVSPHMSIIEPAAAPDQREQADMRMKQMEEEIDRLKSELAEAKSIVHVLRSGKTPIGDHLDSIGLSKVRSVSLL